jgi:dipeptidyl aminopeptidase/acylaminoacyl peptidase
MDQFTFNMNRRNNGWGEEYIYNWTTHKGVQQMPTGPCCYRDARWSPDGTYLFFEYQDQAPDAQAVFYYVAAGELGTNANFKPLPLPAGFFKNPKEGAQAALRLAQKP